MKNEEMNQINEKPVLNMGRIRLTPMLFDEIHKLQTGGLSGEGDVADNWFDNHQVEYEITKFSELSDFIISLYAYDGFDAGVVMELLIDIRRWREHYKSFKV